MSETKTAITAEQPTTERMKTFDVVTRANRTDHAIGGIVDDQERPWNYEQQGRDEVASEYHEANFDYIAHLSQRMDALLGDSDSVETPGLQVTRVELPAMSDGTEPGHRYQIEQSSPHDRLSTTLTVVNGRTELTYYAEPVDTVANPPELKPDQYEQGSWSPEDTAIDYVERSINEKLAALDRLLTEAKTEKANSPAKRSIGEKVLRAVMSDDMYDIWVKK